MILNPYLLELTLWWGDPPFQVMHSDPTRGKQGFKLPDILELAQKLVREPNANGDLYVEQEPLGV